MLNLMSALSPSPQESSGFPLPAEDRAIGADTERSFDHCLAESVGEPPYGKDPEAESHKPAPVPSEEVPEEDLPWDAVPLAELVSETLPPEDLLVEPETAHLSFFIAESTESESDWSQPAPGETESLESSGEAPAPALPSAESLEVTEDLAAFPEAAAQAPAGNAESPDGSPIPAPASAASLAPPSSAPEQGLPAGSDPLNSVPVAEAGIPPAPAETDGSSPLIPAAASPAHGLTPPPTPSRPRPAAPVVEPNLPAPATETTGLPTHLPAPLPAADDLAGDDLAADTSDAIPPPLAATPPTRSEASGEPAPAPAPSIAAASSELGVIPLPGTEASDSQTADDPSHSFQSGASRLAGIAGLGQPPAEPALTSSPSAAPAAATPAPASLSAFMTPAALLEQLDRVVLRSVRADPHSIRVDLEPASLGRVTLHCRETSAGLSVDITVQNPAVRSMLAAQEQDLRLSLESQGLQLGRFSVSYRDGDGRSDADQAGQHREQGDSGESQRRMVSGPAPLAAPASPRPTGPGVRNRWVA